jgi:hypothetical protein
MRLTLEQIEKSVGHMDETYDANFGEWIRNEDNARIVAYNMRKYVDAYKTSDFIVVIKWIVKDWTLKSIIVFAKKMLMEDLKSLSSARGDAERERYMRRTAMLSGLIFTWNPIFITEFVISTTRGLSSSEKCKLLTNLLGVFEEGKLSDTLSQLESKLEPKVHNELTRTLTNDTLRRTRIRGRRTVSMLKAYNLS